MFGCRCCRCSNSIESIDLTKEQTEIVTKRNKLNETKPKSYKKLRLSSFIPENYWVNSQQMNSNPQDNNLNQLNLNQLDHNLDLNIKQKLIEETQPKSAFVQTTSYEIEDNQKINEVQTLLNPTRQITKKNNLKSAKMQNLDLYNSNESFYNFDYNLYSVKKNIGQGMIDLALLAANATQLKNVISKGYHHLINLKFFSTNNLISVFSRPFHINSTNNDNFNSNNKNIDELWSFYLFWLNIFLIGMSIGLQILVGILLLLNAKSNKKVASKPKGNAECYNNTILIFILFITVINVFIVIFVDEV